MKKKLNNITSNFYSDEWYTDANTVKLCYNFMKEHANGVGMFPFDTEKSEFVKQLKTSMKNIQKYKKI